MTAEISNGHPHPNAHPDRHGAGRRRHIPCAPPKQESPSCRNVTAPYFAARDRAAIRICGMGARTPIFTGRSWNCARPIKWWIRSNRTSACDFIAWIPDKGFFLNGQPYALHGVDMHQDRQNKGWAISDANMDENMFAHQGNRRDGRPLRALPAQRLFLQPVRPGRHSRLGRNPASQRNPRHPGV